MQQHIAVLTKLDEGNTAIIKQQYREEEALWKDVQDSEESILELEESLRQHKLVQFCILAFST